MTSPFQEPPASPGRPGSLTLLDWTGIAVAAMLFLSLSFLRSTGTIFWGDEVMGWFVLREPTFPKLLHAWWTGADSSGIFYYILARPWLAIFGASERSLRLLTAASVATACGLMWACARRFYSFGVVAAILPLTLLFHRLILWQLSNGRTYGLFLAAIALAAYAFALSDPARPVTHKLLVLTFAAHLLLVGSHILGVLYSGIFLAGLLVRDLLEHQVRPRLYLAGVTGWLVLLISYRNLVATAAIGKPAFWTLRPHLHEFLLGFTADDHRLRQIIALALLLAILGILRDRFTTRTLILRSSLVSTRLTLIATFFACVPVLFLLSQVTTSVFADRYLLPVVLGDALLLCELATRILEGWRIRLAVQRGLFAVMLLLLAITIKRDLPLSSLEYPQRDYTPELLHLIPAGVPAVITNPATFAEMVFYQNHNGTFLTPLDWQVTLDHASNPGYVSGTHEMEKWKELGFFSSQIQPTSTILANKPRFVVIAEEGQAIWFERRIAASGHFTTQDLGVHQEAGNRMHLWIVTRRQAP